MSTTKGCIEVGEAIIVSDKIVSVFPSVGNFRRCRKVFGVRPQFLIVCYDSAATTGGDGFISVEAQYRELSPVSRVAPLVAGSEGFGGVFHHLKPEFGTQIRQWVKIHGMAEGVHRDDGFDASAGTGVFAARLRYRCGGRKIVLQLEWVDT